MSWKVAGATRSANGPVTCDENDGGAEKLVRSYSQKKMLVCSSEVIQEGNILKEIWTFMSCVRYRTGQRNFFVSIAGKGLGWKV